MRKIFTLGLTLLLAVSALWAGPIDENRAREIAEAFFSAGATRSSSCDVVLEWAGCDLSRHATSKLGVSPGNTKDALLYIFNRSDNHGFVIIAGEECHNPIIAYSDSGAFDIDNMADATRDILSAWSREVEAMPSTSGAATAATTLASESYGTVLCHYDSALWDQSEPFNRECPVIDGYRSLTGCVATAMAIVCYYNKWPEKGSGTTEAYNYYDDYYNEQHYIPSNTLGRTYNYNNMLHDYTRSYTSSQGDAVAQLMYDLGTSVRMSYHYQASGTFSELVASAMSTYFGYSKEALLIYRDRYSTAEWNAMLKENLDKCGPTMYSGVGDEGGHAFIVDGYTDKDYFHFNFGWSGYNNGYYRTPEIEFYEMQDAIFNLTPDKDGTSQYRDYLSLIGYDFYNHYYCGIECSTNTFEVGAPFDAMVGCYCNEGNADFNGTIALAMCDKNDNVIEILESEELSGLSPMYFNASDFYDVTISEAIFPGYKLRVVYKGTNPDEWQIMRGESSDIIDEIILLPSSENLADLISLRYEKSYNGTRSLFINAMHNVDYRCVKRGGLTHATGSIAANDKAIIEFDNYTSGSYTLTLSSGDASISIDLNL